MMSKLGLERGSTWRKWDLHVHTPASALANQFGGNWDAYIDALAGLEDIPVLGITDYFSVDGYRELLKNRSRLTNISLLLPNIELRLKVLAGTKERRINYHVIFSDEFSPDVIEEHFLHELKFDCEAHPEHGVSPWSLKRGNLETVGARLKKEQTTFSGSDYEVGCMNAALDASQISDVLRSKRSIFNDRHLIVLAEAGTSEISWLGQNHLTRKTLLQGCHAVFTSNDKHIKWLRGEGDATASQFRSEFKSLKPAFHGSDAHEISKLCRPDLDRHCWIKADATFEGLRQTLYEPAARVWIGPEPPRQKSSYQVITSIEITDANAWFDPSPVPLNEDLVAVIGGRGSGKSALAELLAFCGGSAVFAGGDIADSFLRKAVTRSETNPQTLVGARVTLRWADGRVDVATINQEVRHGKDQERVKYLPQKFVERLCSPGQTSDLQHEIERIIFQNLPEDQRSQASGFSELRESACRGVEMQRKSTESGIRSIINSIGQQQSRIADRPRYEKELKQRGEELVALLAQPPVVPDEIKGDIEELERLNKERVRLQQDVAAIGQQANQLAEIEARVALFARSVDEYNTEIRELLRVTGLEGHSEAFVATIPAGTSQVIGDRKKDQAAALATIREPLETLTKRIEEIQQRLRIAEAKKREYEQFLRQRTELERFIAAHEREIKVIEDELGPALSRNLDALADRYAEALDLLLAEKVVHEKLYEPLSQALAISDDTARRLSFNSRVVFDSNAACRRLNELLDGRSSIHDVEGLEALLREFAAELLSTGQIRTDDGSLVFERSDLKKATDELLARLTKASDGKPKPLDKQLRTGVQLADFNAELFSSRWFSVAYDLAFDGKPLDLLSPGERGIVLLLLYLEAEKTDNRPLIIDQPEDNLDNMSVFPALVEYFRRRKLSRQIVIVTHNPNLVVNTDAEQVILPSFDGTARPRIQYRGGSLENPDVRELVCKILEGGTEAFRRREEKYSLPA